MSGYCGPEPGPESENDGPEPANDGPEPSKDGPELWTGTGVVGAEVGPRSPSNKPRRIMRSFWATSGGGGGGSPPSISGNK